MNQCELDEQDEYFDSECPQEMSEERENNGNENGDDEEDELDKFMKDIENQIKTEDLAHDLKQMKSN